MHQCGGDLAVVSRHLPAQHPCGELPSALASDGRDHTRSLGCEIGAVAQPHVTQRLPSACASASAFGERLRLAACEQLAHLCGRAGRRLGSLEHADRNRVGGGLRGGLGGPRDVHDPSTIPGSVALLSAGRTGGQASGTNPN